MAFLITEDCINCAACITDCPNMAIYEGGAEWRFSDGTDLQGVLELYGVDADEPHPPKSEDCYYIVSDKCTECVGFYDEPHCVSVCPVECCVPDLDFVESQEELRRKQTSMHSQI
ncbi:MAG TPA: hypothetical protein VGU64_03005 [Terriglobales bacterium]|nr:hypothetical protein [Terriglobales bacterium]